MSVGLSCRSVLDPIQSMWTTDILRQIMLFVLTFGYMGLRRKYRFSFVGTETIN